MKFDEKYNSEIFLSFLRDFLPKDYENKEKDITELNRCKIINKAKELGYCKSIDLYVLEMSHSRETDPRVTIATDGFKILATYGIDKALVVFKNDESENYRFSYLTISLDVNEKNKVVRKYSNARRYSFYLGPGAKINTPTKYLIKKGRISDIDDLKDRFSLEVVNKDFYKEISHLFTKLIGGSFGNSKNKNNYDSLLKLPSVADRSKTSLEFGVRLIGRVIFCWFLREKKSVHGISLMPNELLSFQTSKKSQDYYHKILEPIFFEVLNKPINRRKEEYSDKLFSSIPYLNGGLFSPQSDDYYSYNGGKQTIYQNTVIVPDSWIQDFFEFLETYNFTIDENISFDEELSIDPEMLGRIFENLLAEINPETGESARKSTGSYYTPRMIVDHMVDESLFAYLDNKTKIGDKKLRAVISYNLLDDMEAPLTQDEKEKVVFSLSKIKILDPACGSGAFPIGALQKIVFILQQVDPDGQKWFKKQIGNTSPEIQRVIEREFKNKNFDYIRKLGIIRENIFGVDIQPIATEISRLRCFLTLIVDESIQDSLENRGIEPLPNLDFKFVTANSLIGLQGFSKINQNGLFEDRSGISELQELRDMFFTASGVERDQLKLQFVQVQRQMLENLISNNIRGHAELTTKLTTWDPFSHKASSWFDSEWMFGVKNGFDVVIANPPYLSHVNFSKKEKGLLRTSFQTFKGRADIYIAFYEQGIKLLKDNGNLIYITPNKFFRAGYGEKLRKYLKDNTKIISIIDFGDASIFEATTYSSIILLQKNSLQKSKFSFLKIKKLEELYHKKNFEMLDSNYLSNDLWTFENEDLLQIWKKMKFSSVGLLEYINNKFYRGIVTGLNEAFIIDEKQKDILIKKNILVSEIIKPYLRGRNVKRWVSNSNSYVIFTYHGVDINKYPEILDYLSPFKDKLEKRATSENHKWYELQQPQTGIYKYYKQTKIISTDIAKRCEFTIDDSGFYIDATIFCIPFNDLYLLAILNSKLIEAYYRNQTSTIRGDFLRFKKIYLGLLPIKEITDDRKEIFIKLAEKIITLTKCEDYIENNFKHNQVREYEKEIDQVVYQLYNLTKKEIKLIESSC